MKVTDMCTCNINTKFMNIENHESTRRMHKEYCIDGDQCKAHVHIGHTLFVSPKSRTIISISS